MAGPFFDALSVHLCNLSEKPCNLIEMWYRVYRT